MSVAASAFKEALAHWASGVTIVTTINEGKRIGITASSFNSVSLDPPRISVCVAKRLYTHGAIMDSGFFAVNILSTEQLEWGMRFAGLLPEIEDRFRGIPSHEEVTGAPILSDTLGWLDCRLWQGYDGGDHTIFVGDIVSCGVGLEGRPILYFNRHWRQLDAQVLTLD